MKTEERSRAVLERRGEKRRTLATAESCTGGLVGKLLTDIPGSSAVYLGGVISYTNGVKRRLLGVPEAILEQYTAVSRQTAENTAPGARIAVGADCALGVTGLAGPDGDGSGRPVGLVYISFSDGTNTAVKELHLSGSRTEIREAAARALLQLALENL